MGEQPNAWRAQAGKSQSHGLDCTRCRNELPLHPPRLGVASLSFLSCLVCLVAWQPHGERAKPGKMASMDSVSDSKMAFLQSVTYCHKYPRSHGAWTGWAIFRRLDTWQQFPLCFVSTQCKPEGKLKTPPHNWLTANSWTETNQERNKSPSITTWLQHFSSIVWGIL